MLALTSFMKNASLVRSAFPVSSFALDDPGIMNSPSQAFANVVGARSVVASVVALSADLLSSLLFSCGCLSCESRNPPNQILAGVIGMLVPDVDETMCFNDWRWVLDVGVRRSCKRCSVAGERQELLYTLEAGVERKYASC